MKIARRHVAIVIKLLRQIRDALRDLTVLQQQQVDLYRALVSDDRENK